jgi:hypothetical protein
MFGEEAYSRLNYGGLGCGMQILIDELVLPNKKVVDYLTHITGGKAEDLEGVSLTQEAVQVCCQPQFTIYGLLRI